MHRYTTTQRACSAMTPHGSECAPVYYEQTARVTPHHVDQLRGQVIGPHGRAALHEDLAGGGGVQQQGLTLVHVSSM